MAKSKSFASKDCHSNVCYGIPIYDTAMDRERPAILRTRRETYGWGITIPNVERYRLIVKPLDCQRHQGIVRIGNLRCKRYVCECENTIQPN